MNGKWTVRREQDDNRLLDFLHGVFNGERSKREIRRAIERGQVTINGRPTLRANVRVSAGQKIFVQMDFFKRAMPLLGFHEERLLYADDSLIAYDKPAMINCDADGILAVIRTQYPEAELVHRLDADTSGVLLLSRTAQAKLALEALFRDRAIQKSYVCLVDGVPEERQGQIESYLGKVEERHGQVVWGEVSEGRGRFAQTYWEMKKCGERAALLICRPTTGRTHQIRIHMASMGHPILGDHRYGRRFSSGYYPHRHLLHARRLEFLHPVTEERVSISAEVPPLFQEAAEELKLSRV